MQYFVSCTKWYNYVKSTTIYLPRLRSYCILFSLYYIWFRDLKTHYCMHTHFPVEVRYVYFFSMWCTCRALSISLSISWKAIIHTGGSLVHLVGWVHNFIRYTAQCHISRTWVLHGLLLGTTLHNHTSFSIGTTLQQTFLTWRKTYDCSWILTFVRWSTTSFHHSVPYMVHYSVHYSVLHCTAHGPGVIKVGLLASYNRRPWKSNIW